MNKLPTEVAAIVGVINPDAYANATYTTNYIALKDFRRFMAVVMVGAMGAGATIDAKLIAYTNSSGGGATDIPGAVIAQLTQAGTDSNKQVVLNLNTDVLAGNTLYTHFRLQVVIGTAACDMGAIVFAFDPRYNPASDNDLASVDEIVSV